MAIVIEREPTLRAALSAGVNLFLGSGFSVLASSEAGGNLPLGDALKVELCSVFSRHDLAALPLPRVYDVLYRQKPDEIIDFLNARFKVATYDPRYLSLLKLKILAIITTNIDDLVYKIFASNPRRYLNDVIIGGSAFKAEDAVDYIPLHGSILHEEENYTFGSIDLASAFARDPDRFHFLTERLQRSPTIFSGYSLQDAGALQALDKRTIGGRDYQQKWIQLYNPTDADKTYFSALGFSLIIGDTAELLEYFAGISSGVPAALVSDVQLHKYERIPQLAEVKSRSISDFYLGSPPVWHDVLTNRLPRLSYYKTCEDLINSGEHVFIAGTPQSGKSTLIMQLAALSDMRSARVFLEAGDAGKARSLVSRLSGKPSIIFIDDAANSSDVLNVLTETPNVTVVAADRHFNIETASHRFERGRFKVVDISDLSEQDMRDLFSAIPQEIRKPKFTLPKMTPGRSPSLYELIAFNARGSKLSERFALGIRDMEQRGVEAHDLFLMMSYVHSCRTPVSFDMAWAFLQARDYKQVYAEIEKLGALLSEYAGDAEIVLDDAQDYYSPRSVYIAEAVLSACSRDAFRRMFLRFHHLVSSFRIAQFDIFKRQGYDAGFAQRAFLDAKEGMKFYGEAFERDGSYYLLQQKAIYLARQKMFKEAFATIDDALLLSRGRIPTIRHTHAEILFDANINLAHSDPSARLELKKSLGILEECRRYDKRKAYHAFKFAELACSYYDAYGDDEATNYLKQAASWLEEELLNPFAARRAKSHLRNLRSRLPE
jgi:energy-coupling factor transporter ATP-binding protein EcfA2